MAPRNCRRLRPAPMHRASLTLSISSVLQSLFALFGARRGIALE